MSYKTVGKKAREWAARHPHLANAVANLRGQAGMSEDAIYHTIRREVAKKDAPSIREIRAAWEAFQVTHERIAGERNRRISFKDREVEEGRSEYRKNRKAQFSARQMDELNRKVVVGYLIRAETPSEEWADPDAYLEWSESRGYDETPPF